METLVLVKVSPKQQVSRLENNFSLVFLIGQKDQDTGYGKVQAHHWVHRVNVLVESLGGEC